MRGGYRDRLLTELAQNAVDAALAANVPARLRLRRVDDTIRVANVGIALDRSGVEALASLRASDKASADGRTGRYGVGFTAVRTIADRIEVRSRNGSVGFDVDATAGALRDRGITADALDRHDLPLPGLRLPWPLAAAPAEGWDTEIVLHPRADLDIDALLTGLAADAPDVMLDLAGLTELTVDDPPVALTRTIERRDDGIEILTIRDGDTARHWWVTTSDAPASRTPVRWLWPQVDGGPGRAKPDVLRAPTRSDEPLTLPALVVADLPLQPDRRRLMPTVDAAGIVGDYAAMVARLPAPVRTVAVPEPGLPAGEVDAALREAIVRRLRTDPWIDDTDRRPIRGADAVVLPDADAAAAEVFADLIPGLVHPDMSTRRDVALLRSVGARVLGVADLVDALAGQSRPPNWWRRVYDVLDRRVLDAVDRDNCGSLPVPLADGRLVTGPRTVVIADGFDIPESSDTPEGSDGPAAVDWVRVVHPDAVHPLLTTLGARDARPADLLADPALGERILAVDDLTADRPDDPEARDEALRLARTVLALAAAIDGPPEPLAIPGLGSVLLDDVDGDLRAADELLLPDAPLWEVLADDAPVGRPAPHWIDRFGAAALRRVGVGWDFTIVVDEAPTAPEHLLDDEETWWDELPVEPPTMVAIRDLDLIAPDRWVHAIDMMLGRPETAAAFDDPDGYTPWWIRRHARVDGLSPALFTAGDGPLTGLLDPWPGRRRPPAGLLAGDTVTDADQAAELLLRLADPNRSVPGATAIRVHDLLGQAVADGRLDPAAIDPPDRVRTPTGETVDAADAYVLDRPWLVAVIDPTVTVVGSLAGAEDLAELLDLDIASTALDARVTSTGSARQWAADPRRLAAGGGPRGPPPPRPGTRHPAPRGRPAGAAHHPRGAGCDDDGVHIDEIFGPAAIATIARVLGGDLADRSAAAGFTATP